MILDEQEGFVMNSLTYSLVILNWNSVDDVCSLLGNLSKQHQANTIVVDNASDNAEEEVSTLLSLFPEISVVRSVRNGGYAAGMNLGVLEASSRSEAAILLNADARPTDSALETIGRALQLYDLVGVRQSSDRSLKEEYATAGFRKGLVFQETGCHGCAQGLHKVDVVSGAVIGLKIKAWQALGGINEKYFHYKEEVDFSLRAKDLGFSIVWLCEVTVFHERGGSLSGDSALATYYRARNEILFFIWNSNFRALARLSPRLLLTEAHHFVRAARARQMRGFARGVLDGVRANYGPCTRVLF